MEFVQIRCDSFVGSRGVIGSRKNSRREALLQDLLSRLFFHFRLRYLRETITFQPEIKRVRYHLSSSYTRPVPYYTQVHTRFARITRLIVHHSRTSSVFVVFATLQSLLVLLKKWLTIECTRNQEATVPYLHRYFTSPFRTGYVKWNGVVLPKNYKNFGEKVQKMAIRSDDTWVCAAPKSGKLEEGSSECVSGGAVS